MFPSLAELQRRIVYAILKPAMRLCREFQLPLGVVEELTRMAYFEEVRICGNASHVETATLMDKSLRTVGNLEKQYRSGFLAPEAALEHARQVENALSHGSLTLTQVHEHAQHLDKDSVARLLTSLANVGRIHVEGLGDTQVYTLNSAFASLVRDDVDAQLDGLRHQLDVIVSTVRTRFFAPGRPAVARTLNFVADEAEMEVLADEFVLALRRRCIEAEESALKRKIRVPYAATFALTPMNGQGKSEP